MTTLQTGIKFPHTTVDKITEHLLHCSPADHQELRDADNTPIILEKDDSNKTYSGKYGTCKYEYAYWMPHCSAVDLNQPKVRRPSLQGLTTVPALTPDWSKLKGFDVIPWDPGLGPQGRQKWWSNPKEPEGWDGPIAMIKDRSGSGMSFADALAMMSGLRAARVQYVQFQMPRGAEYDARDFSGMTRPSGSGILGRDADA